MDFQVHDETYYLGLAADERRWVFFVSTPEGMRPIPVYIDAPETEDLTLVVEDGERRKVVN